MELSFKFDSGPYGLNRHQQGCNKSVLFNSNLVAIKLLNVFNTAELQKCIFFFFTSKYIILREIGMAKTIAKSEPTI